jgi:rhodanese-related sulfurtransferase
MKIIPALAMFLSMISFGLAADAPKIPAAEAAKLVKEGKAVIVDVREPAEYAQAGVAAPAVLLPKSDFDGDQKLWKEFLAKNKGKQVITYCRSGGRASAVAEALNKQGVPAANLGGLKDWTNAGLPTRTVEEKK